MSRLYGTDLALVRLVVAAVGGVTAPPDASLSRRFLCLCLVFPNCSHLTAHQLYPLFRKLGRSLTQVTTCFSLNPVARASSRLSPLFGRAPVARASYADWRRAVMAGVKWPARVVVAASEAGAEGGGGGEAEWRSWAARTSSSMRFARSFAPAWNRATYTCSSAFSHSISSASESSSVWAICDIARP